MKKFVAYLTFFVTAFPAGIESIMSQYVNISQFGSATINPLGTLVTVSSCSNTDYTDRKTDRAGILDRFQFRNNSSMAG